VAIVEVSTYLGSFLNDFTLVLPCGFLEWLFLPFDKILQPIPYILEFRILSTSYIELS